MRCGRGWVKLLAVVIVFLPSCAASSSAPKDASAGSFVRVPSGSARSTAVRSLPPSRLPDPGDAGASLPLDDGMRQVAAQAGVRKGFPWRYIVLHHSASPAGNAATFAQEHKKRGWDGLGYHFVIGNGSKSGDGQVEVGYRWPGQLQGAHAGSYQYNRYGIGVCLVGNFDQTRPSSRQMASLERLVAYLMIRFGIPSANVIEHREVRQTACPGRHFPLPAILTGASSYQRQLAGSGLAIPAVPAPVVDPILPPGGPASTVLRPAGPPVH